MPYCYNYPEKEKDMTEKPKRPRGRPVEKPLPEPIDASPEDVMRAILATPPRKDEDWPYMQKADD